MVLFSLFFAFKSSFNLDRLKLICKVNKEKSVAKISCSKEHISETGTGNAMNVRRTGIASVGCFCLRLPTFDCCPPRSRGERERECSHLTQAVWLVQLCLVPRCPELLWAWSRAWGNMECSCGRERTKFQEPLGAWEGWGGFGSGDSRINKVQ